MHCDQTFRYYEPEKSSTDIIVPNFLKYSGVGKLQRLNLCKIKCSNKNFSVAASVSAVDSSDQLRATVKSLEAGSVQKGFVFIYGDDFCSELRGVCCIEVHALQLIRFGVRAGVDYDFPLRIKRQVAKQNAADDPDNASRSESVRTIELFSSDPELIRPPNGK